MTDPILRHATPDDMAAIAALYAHYVTTSTATFETVPPSARDMAARWQAIRDFGGPYVVAEQGGRLLGYAYAGAYRPRPAYDRTVENSIYLAPDATGRGLGRMLLSRIINDSTARGFTQMIAVIAGNTIGPSIRLHQTCGFVLAGRLTGVGFKFDQWLDTTLMQRTL